MATGLDVAAGIAGLITLADVVIDRTARTIRACKNAGKDSQRLLREVQLLLGILNGVKTIASQIPKGSLQALISSDLIQDCQKTLTSVRDKLIKANPDENGISKATRILRILKWPITEPETQKIMLDLERYKTAFDLSLSLDSLQSITDSRATQSTIARGVEDVRKALAEITRIQINDERHNVLKFFGTFDMEEPHGGNTQLRHPGTNMWFTQGPEFTSWLQSRNSKLWIYGIPGAGKTVLAAASIEETMQYVDPEYGVAYYYCDYKVVDSQRLQKMFACLAGQLGRQNEGCLDELSKIYRPDPDQSPKSSLPSEKDLSKLLSGCITHFDQVAIIVDGVEECNDPSNVAIALSDLVSQCPQLRLLVSSRDEQTIRPHFHDFEKLSIAARNEDLSLYVSAEIEERSKRGALRIKSTALKDEILDRLINGAEGMFRWVACQMDHLSALPSDAARRKALQQLPPDLYTTYDRILERVCAAGEENCSLVQRVLYWLFSSSLRSEILLEAVSVEAGCDFVDPESRPDDEDILLTCSSLVRVGAEECLELAHFTVKEYLSSPRIRDDPKLGRFHCEVASVNEYKALTCLRYMSFPQFAMADVQHPQQYRDLTKNNPFYSFAAWRFDSFILHSTSPDVEDLAVKFFCYMPHHFMTWKYTFIVQEYTNSGFTDWDDHVYARLKGVGTFAKPQHIAAMLALQKLLKRILDEGFDANDRSPLGTPLHCALGGTELLGLIVDRRQTVDWDSQAAVDESLQATLQTLLDHGADVNEPFLLENICDVSEESYCTPACFASRITNLAVTKTLFNGGARLDRHTMRGLFQCKFEKDADKMELLDLLTGKSVSDEDIGLYEVLKSKLRPSNQTAPQPSSRSPNMQRQGLTINDVEQCFRWACENDDLEMLESLIAFDAENLDKVLSEPSHGYLHAAAYRGSSRVVNKLLEYGVSADAIDPRAATPLHAALYVESCRSGLYKQLDYVVSIDVILSLLDHGADATKLDQNQDSVLHGFAAIKRPSTDGKCKQILDLLLSKGVDPMLQDFSGETMLHAAALYDARDRIEELRAAIGPTKFDELKVIADKRHAMPVHVAARGGGMNSLKYLRDFHPKEGQLTDEGRNEVTYAAQGSGWDNLTLEFLLQSGVTASMASKEGSTALHFCVQGLASLHDSKPENRVATAAASFAEAIKMLEAHGCDISQAREDKTTPLHVLCHITAQTGFHAGAERCKFCRVFCDCMDVLLDHTVDLNDPDKSGRTAMAILLHNCFRTYPDSFDISTVNHAAVETLYRVLMRCEPDQIKDLRYRGMSALAIAAMLHHDNMVIRLLELGADVDEKGIFDVLWTPIQLIARQGCGVKVVEMALKATKSPKQRNANGDTLLHLATSSRGRKSHPDVLKALLRAGIDVDARSDSHSETALMSSAQTGSLDEMKILLAAGADVDASDDTGGTALAKACWGGHLPAVQLLLDSGCKNDFSAKRYFNAETHVSVFGSAPIVAGPLHLAAEAGNVELVRLLLESRDTPAEDAKVSEKASPLWWACYFGHLDVVRLLLQHGFDPDAIDSLENLSCLHIAVVFTQLSVMQLLLDAGCDEQALDRLQRTPMDHATANGSQAAIQIIASHRSRKSLLRPRSADIPAKPSTPLRPPTSKSMFSPPYIMEVIDKGDLEAVHRLYESGVDFSLRYAECTCTPLLEAMMLGKANIAIYLLDKKVSIKGTTCEKHTTVPFTAGQAVARKPEQLGILLKLLDCQEDSSVKDGLAYEMLVTAATEGNLPAVNELISRGHINARPNERTDLQHPLFSAIRSVEEPIALALLDAGIDHKITDKGLVTPLHVAADLDLEDVVIKLLDLGANPNAREDDLRSPTMWAAWAGREEIVDLFIERGAHLGIGNIGGPSVITEAIRGGHLEYARELITKYCKPPASVVKSIQYRPIAFDAGSSARTFVLNLGLDLDYEQYLFEVFLPNSRSWFRRIVKLLPVDVLFRNLTYQRQPYASLGQLNALHHHIMKGDHRGVLRLLKSGAMVNMECGHHGTPLMIACRYGRVGIAKMLLRRRALLSYVKNGETFSAVKEAAGYPEIIRWILVNRHTDQKKLKGPPGGSEAAFVPDCESAGSFAEATSFGFVPWNTTQFIAAEDVDEFIGSTRASFRRGTFYCREDGFIALIEAESFAKPWDLDAAKYPR